MVVTCAERRHDTRHRKEPAMTNAPFIRRERRLAFTAGCVGVLSVREG